MKTPDKHIIDRTLDNTATPEEARQVIRWFSRRFPVFVIANG